MTHDAPDSPPPPGARAPSATPPEPDVALARPASAAGALRRLLLHRPGAALAGSVALGAPLLAGALVWALGARLDGHSTLPFVLAVLLAALVGGFRAGVVASLASVLLLVAGAGAEPAAAGSGGTESGLGGVLGCALLLGVGLAVSGIAERLRRVTQGFAERGRELADRHARLVASEACHRVLSAASPVGIFHADLAGLVTYADARVAELWELPPGALLGRGWSTRVHPDDVERLASEWARASAAGEDYELEYRVCLPGGRERRIHGRSAVVRDARGRGIGTVGTVEDVTEQRALATQLATREAEFRTMADNLPQLTWTAGPDGAVQWYNRRFHEYTGTTPAEVHGWGWRTLHHPEHLARVEARFLHSISTGEPWEDTFPMRAADGSWRWFLSRALPIRDESGRIVRWFGTNTDVTAEREAAAERERLLAAERSARAAADEANQAKSEFLARMSHELRTPLNAIGGHVQLVEMGLYGPVTEPQREALARVNGAQRHLLGLIDDVLNFAKLEAGRIEFALRPVRLLDVLDAVRPMVAPQMVAKGLHFAVALPDGLASDGLAPDGLAPRPDDAGGEGAGEEAPLAQLVWADRDKLVQVLLNLLSNAIKFTPRGGRVVLEVALGREHAALCVRDTGIGIAPDRLAGIFEPFVQAHGRSALTREHEGTGLGLAISRDLARGMGGELGVESTLGVGSTFRVRLRRAVAEGGARTDRRHRTQRRSGDERRLQEERRGARPGSPAPPAVPAAR